MRWTKTKRARETDEEKARTRDGRKRKVDGQKRITITFSSRIISRDIYHIRILLTSPVSTHVPPSTSFVT
jgi:hypothetical protein